MLTTLQYKVLKALFPGEPRGMDGSAYTGKSKLQVLLGSELLGEISGKTVVDFGCGEGHESVGLARSGAGKVIGVDIRESVLEKARLRAREEGVADRCEFTARPEEKADLIVSIDSFEHFSDPADILRIMHGLLRPGGAVLASFGPTWYHPLGGHLFSVFPWAHVLFSERALIRWRADIRSDGATRFGEVDGGLNQMTIGRFERLVEASPYFGLESMEAVPIGRLRPAHNRLTREFTTAIVRARLRRKDGAAGTGV